RSAGENAQRGCGCSARTAPGVCHADGVSRRGLAALFQRERAAEFRSAAIASKTSAARGAGMKNSSKRPLALADVTLFPAFVIWFIWQGQFIARWTWVFLVVWIAGSFVAQRDTPKTLGWRADNLSAGFKQAA